MKPDIYCFLKISICLLLISLLPFALSAQNQNDRHFFDSLQTVLKTANDSEKIRIVAEHIVHLMDCKDSAEKIRLGEQAKLQAEKIRWNLEIANANRALGDVYFDCIHNYDKAFEYFHANVALAEKNKDVLSQSIALETIAKQYQKISQHGNALEYFNKAISLNRDADFTMGVLGDMGVTYTTIGDFAHALVCYTNSLRLLDSLLASKKTNDAQDTSQMIGLLLNIGDIYLSMSQPDKSFENYNQALKISNELNDKYPEIWSLVGIGKTFLAKKEYNQAVDNYLKAINDCDTINNLKDKGRILVELAGAYLDVSEFDKAMDCAQNALKIGEQYQQNDLVQRAYTKLGMIYLNKGQHTAAVLYLKKSLALGQKTGILDEEKDAWQALSTAYKQMGKPAEALDAYTNFITIRDSLYSISKANALTSIDLEFRFKKEQLADTAKYNEKIQRQRIYTYTGFAGAALILLLSFFMYRNYDTTRKYNELLSKEQERQLAHIEAQDNVLTDIAHTQAHFVRGPVATILGLVQFFNFEDLTDPVNKEIMEGVVTVTEKLDTVVKDIVIKENKLRRETKK
jgi:tetratricopeptide (TPR) repeat protein